MGVIFVHILRATLALGVGHVLFCLVTLFPFWQKLNHGKINHLLFLFCLRQCHDKMVWPLRGLRGMEYNYRRRWSVRWSEKGINRRDEGKCHQADGFSQPRGPLAPHPFWD